MKGGVGNLMFGVRVKEGKLKVGTPISFIPINNTTSEKGTFLGNITSLQKNNEDIIEANENDNVCIRIDNPNEISYDRHFDFKNKIVSKLTRESINILKYRDK